MKTITTETEDFKEFIDNGYYYVDKSDFIKSCFKSKVTLFTRPKQFGKTLNLSMLNYFFSIKEKDNAYLFNDLKISKDKDMMKHQNQYLTIFITLKDMKNDNFEKQLSTFSTLIKDIIDSNLELLSSERINEINKEMLNKYYKETKDEVDLQNSLKFICKCLKQHYRQNVIILIDDYDVPLLTSYQYDYYDKMMNFMNAVFSTVLKTNNSLETGILTGYLRILFDSGKRISFCYSSEFSIPEVSSIFNYNISSSQFGFTQSEVDKILEYYDLTQYKNKIKEWYGGYLFGNTEIYNPLSTLTYINKLLISNKKNPESYWINKKSNSIINDNVYGEYIIKVEFEKLIQGNSIIKYIYPSVGYRELDRKSNIYSLLLFTGYLTIKKKLKLNEYELVIPNKEVKNIYEQLFYQHFNKFVEDRKDIFVDTLIQGNTEQINDLLNDILENYINSIDNYDCFYHDVLIDLLSNEEVSSIKETKKGKFIIFISPKKIPNIVVIKYKHSKKLSHLIKDSENAAKQIIFENNKTIGYGISFYKKKCYITKG